MLKITRFQIVDDITFERATPSGGLFNLHLTGLF